MESKTASPISFPFPQKFSFLKNNSKKFWFFSKETNQTHIKLIVIFLISFFIEKAFFGEEEWYFFTPRDRKYPNGARPNRMAATGYWKATGTDRPVFSSAGSRIIGVKNALVFYKGRPPRGIKRSWTSMDYSKLWHGLQRRKGQWGYIVIYSVFNSLSVRLCVSNGRGDWPVFGRGKRSN